MVLIDINGQRKRIVAARHSGDIEFFSDVGTDAVDKESVPLIGPFEDKFPSGDNNASGGVPTRAQMMATNPNKLFGTRAWLNGARLPNLNEVGENANITRRRKRLITKEVPDSSIFKNC